METSIFERKVIFAFEKAIHKSPAHTHTPHNMQDAVQQRAYICKRENNEMRNFYPKYCVISLNATRSLSLVARAWQSTEANCADFLLLLLLLFVRYSSKYSDANKANGLNGSSLSFIIWRFKCTHAKSDINLNVTRSSFLVIVFCIFFSLVLRIDFVFMFLLEIPALINL